MTAVVRWSGREAWALRLAQRMSVREFAAHLGVTDAAVSNWERRRERARLRYHTQQLLDTDLQRAVPEVQARFFQVLAEDEPQDAGRAASSALTDVGADAAPTPRASPLEAALLGEQSAIRTSALLRALAAGTSSLSYVAPADAAERLVGFLASSSRVFLIKGPPGCGKTLLTRHLANEVAPHADLQLLHIDPVGSQTLDLSSEILRYARLPPGADPLLTLEQQTARLQRPCLVVLDGISSQQAFDDVARQVEVILRQVVVDRLRFLFVLRTPPDIELSGYPVLSASTLARAQHGTETAYTVMPWSLPVARAVWDASRPQKAPAFRDLPRALQQLMRVPLYMHLVSVAGPDGPPDDVDPLHLIDQCVRRILRTSIQDVDVVLEKLEDLAILRLPHLLLGSTPGHQPAARVAQTSLAQSAPGIVQLSPAGEDVFAHDVFAEFFVAARIANDLTEQGPSLGTTAAVNELASRAMTSANARGVFDLVIRALDSASPDILATVATAPTVSTTSTLPLLMSLTAESAHFATSDVLRSCARRCQEEPALDLARALLTGPTASALGDDFPAWLLQLLDRYGAAIWNDVAAAIERTMDRDATRRLLDAADLDNPQYAVFFARFFFLFTTPDADPTTALVPDLAAHPDWRVRAALAEGLRDRRSLQARIYEQILAVLSRDRDYRVRAGAALALPLAAPATAGSHLPAMLRDENWHVRERALQGLLAQENLEQIQRGVQQVALDILHADDSWSRCPAHVQPLVHRLLLLSGQPHAAGDSAGRRRALIVLLREISSGWLRVDDESRTALIKEALRSGDRLLARVAKELDPSRLATGQSTDPTRRREAFRRLRNRRSLQIALDVHDVDDALRVSAAVASTGVDFLEVGDPLIKRAGLDAVRMIKEQTPDVAVIAEMMSSDWGRDQVVLAAEAGADVVLLIGPASLASVSAAAEAGRRLGIPVMLDASPAHVSATWVRDMERAGVDGFSVTTNIDLGIGVRSPLEIAATLRGWTQLPVAVSGGFSPTDPAPIRSTEWDILIVGRSVTDAVDPISAAQLLADLVHQSPNGATCTSPR